MLARHLEAKTFQADTRKVHRLLKNYLVDETAKQCISSIEKNANVQDKFYALYPHYSSKGNVIRQVATAYRLQEMFNYKS